MHFHYGNNTIELERVHLQFSAGKSSGNPMDLALWTCCIPDELWEKSVNFSCVLPSLRHSGGDTWDLSSLLLASPLISQICVTWLCRVFLLWPFFLLHMSLGTRRKEKSSKMKTPYNCPNTWFLRLVCSQNGQINSAYVLDFCVFLSDYTYSSVKRLKESE